MGLRTLCRATLGGGDGDATRKLPDTSWERGQRVERQSVHTSCCHRRSASRPLKCATVALVCTQRPTHRWPRWAQGHVHARYEPLSNIWTTHDDEGSAGVPSQACLVVSGAYLHIPLHIAPNLQGHAVGRIWSHIGSVRALRSWKLGQHGALL